MCIVEQKVHYRCVQFVKLDNGQHYTLYTICKHVALGANKQATVIHSSSRNKVRPQVRREAAGNVIKCMCAADGNAIVRGTLTLCNWLLPPTLFFLQLVSLASSRHMLGTLNAPSVLHTAPAMTRPPPSVTATKASTELSKTPPPWLVQVSRVVMKSKLSVSWDVLSFCLHVSNLFLSVGPSFPHPSALFLYFSNIIELNLDICLHNFIPPYLNFGEKKTSVVIYLIHGHDKF